MDNNEITMVRDFLDRNFPVHQDGTRIEIRFGNTSAWNTYKEDKDNKWDLIYTKGTTEIYLVRNLDRDEGWLLLIADNFVDFVIDEEFIPYRGIGYYLTEKEANRIIKRIKSGRKKKRVIVIK